MSRPIARAARALALALTATSAASAARAAQALPQATVTCNIPQPCALDKNANGIGLSATSAKSEGLFGSTTFSATSTSNRTYGVEGVDASTNNNAYNAGLYGLSPHGYGVYATSTAGVGVRAVSSSGYGLNATSSSNTAALGTTTATSGKHAGLMGVDTSTNNGYNDGVLGVTSSGGFGVEGISNDQSYGGVGGTATTGTGVNGASTSGAGVIGTSTSGTAVLATSTSGTGVWGTGTTGVFATTTSSTGAAVIAKSARGPAVLAEASGDGVGLLASSAGGDGADISGKYGIVGLSDNYPLILKNADGVEEFFVDGKGNVTTRGTYTTLVRMRNGASATSFMPHATSSTVEDTGTARLTGGAATVRFDPTFAASIDGRTMYQVFLTPGGDTRGLYVANKTQAGFDVRESQGGRSTVAFDYRIVASLSGHTNDRMALVSATAFGPRSSVSAHVPTLPVPTVMTKKGGMR